MEGTTPMNRTDSTSPPDDDANGDANRNARGDRDDCPSAIELAAWWDRRLDEAHSDRIDVHVARCSECLALVDDLQAIDSDATGVPEHVVLAASSLVAPSSYRFIDHLSRARPRALPKALAQAFAGAAALAIVSVGFQMGGSIVQNSSTTDLTSDTVPIESDLTFGLLDDDATEAPSDALDLATSLLLVAVMR